MKTLIRKAVVPAAGLGTRHFPASHAVKKELFPVVGKDGIARALFHYHLIDLVEAGIQDICIIVQPGDDALFRSYLLGPDTAYLKRLEKYPSLHAEALRMRELSKIIHFEVQTSQEGFGHAVYQTRKFVNNEPFMLCLGDHLFQGKTISPYKELIQSAELALGKSLSAVNKISAQELKGFGTIAGVRRPVSPLFIDVNLIIEKPSVEIAREKLRVDGLRDDEYLGWFGMHVLSPSIFNILEEMIRDNIRDNGEFQLTRAQEIQRQKEGYMALEMTSAKRFDFGVPDDFVKSIGEFRNF